ncbi:hypothetical protein NC651_020371 [Populus alba x Populus x berolinensis]|nr:hypothetical protein NC651_020371 [Populus alba x Populus x berolinensis]
MSPGSRELHCLDKQRGVISQIRISFRRGELVYDLEGIGYITELLELSLQAQFGRSCFSDPCQLTIPASFPDESSSPLTQSSKAPFWFVDFPNSRALKPDINSSRSIPNPKTSVFSEDWPKAENLRKQRKTFEHSLKGGHRLWNWCGSSTALLSSTYQRISYNAVSIKETSIILLAVLIKGNRNIGGQIGFRIDLLECFSMNRWYRSAQIIVLEVIKIGQSTRNLATEVVTGKINCFKLWEPSKLRGLVTKLSGEQVTMAQLHGSTACSSQLRIL